MYCRRGSFIVEFVCLSAVLLAYWCVDNGDRCVRACAQLYMYMYVACSKLQVFIYLLHSFNDVCP